MNNTRQGPFPATAGEDLSSSLGLLAVLVNSSGSPVAKLPDAVTDRAVLQITKAAASGALATLDPLEPGRPARIPLDGTCVTGDRLVLAAIDGTKDGKVRKLPATAGTYFSPGFARESGADGQSVLMHVDPLTIVVSA